MRKYLLLFLMCVVSMTIYAEEYWIEGTITARRVGEAGNYRAEFVLDNPVGQGIYFDPVFQIVGIDDTTYVGTKIFTFRNAKTDCPDGFEKGLHFERWENGEWQRDTETRVGEARGSKTSWTTMILVLDRTTSLGKDGLADVKTAAKDFIEAIVNKEDYEDGSVHLGIVAFAAEPEISPIIPLGKNNVNTLVNFIKGLDMQNNTYLYRAMDEAVSMFENYDPTINGKNWDDFKGASLITFTDGFDNGSINIEQNLMTNNDYYQYLKDQRLNVTIGEQTINSYMISVKGNDVKEESSYVDKLRKLATIESQFFNVATTGKLKEKFEEILNQLTVQWIDLNCYIPQHQGRVRWVLDCGEPKPTKEPKKPSAYMSQLGFILGANNGITGKGYATDKHFAYEFDASCNLYTYSLDFLSNYMYQNVAHQGKKSDMHWYIGGGASLGYSLGYIHETYDYHEQHWADWRIGANAIIGLEWIFRNSPFVLSLDYRPGIQYFIGWDCDALYFDYLNLNLGLRWYF